MTPLVVLKTSQLDLARAAIERGVRNVFAVASWDNLSSKGELTFAPQRVVVWNDVQKQEAIDLHGVPAGRIEVTGAQVFDEWFVKQPATSREEFCARVGPARRPPDRALRVLGAARGQRARNRVRRCSGCATFVPAATPRCASAAS